MQEYAVIVCATLDWLVYWRWAYNHCDSDLLDYWIESGKVLSSKTALPTVICLACRANTYEVGLPRSALLEIPAWLSGSCLHVSSHTNALLFSVFYTNSERDGCECCGVADMGATNVWLNGVFYNVAEWRGLTNVHEVQMRYLRL